MFNHRVVLSLAFAFPFSLLTQTPVQSEFVGGIDSRDAQLCKQKIEQSHCKLKEWFNEYHKCVKTVLKTYSRERQTDPICRQSLVFFNLTGGGLLRSIRNYPTNNPTMQVVLADYVYIADQGSGYFIVTKEGRFFALPLLIPKKELKKVSGYQNIVKNYRRADLWQILGFPTGQFLADNKYRLIFTQELKDGCNACAVVGTAKVAYDFSRDGNVFYGAKVLMLTPRFPK